METVENKLNDFLQNVEIESTELERHSVLTSIPIDEEDFERIKGNTEISIHSPVGRQIKNAIIELTLEIYGRDGELLEVKYPKTWWDHFKQAWFPERLKKRFPVEYTCETYQPKQFLPDIPTDEHTLEFITTQGAQS